VTVSTVSSPCSVAAEIPQLARGNVEPCRPGNLDRNRSLLADAEIAAKATKLRDPELCRLYLASRGDERGARAHWTNRSATVIGQPSLVIGLPSSIGSPELATQQSSRTEQ
jgi:hypothetical protein